LTPAPTSPLLRQRLSGEPARAERTRAALEAAERSPLAAGA
jgi:hypothetical protein